ncbi:MAG: GNAT family N-acetyltransferase [Deinococcus sp.]|nr:GNAT family N-acetyltransferase [Deinococcus sp.]
MGGAGLTLLDWGLTRDDPQPWRGRVVNVWTHPAQRRQGVARQLVTHALAAAAARGVRVLSLGTTPAGRPLYEALGFEEASAEMVRRFPRQELQWAGQYTGPCCTSVTRPWTTWTP